MKRFLVLFFAALLITSVSFSEEESFFTEESFGSTIFANDEAFFEESSFFGENGSVNSITEDSALPPVEGPAGADVEGRSLLLLATDTENPYPYPAPTYTYKKGYDPENPDKLKPGEVKLTWEQKDQNGTVIKKLAKGWKWVIYETDPENGVWLQVGTTTKPTITLKNQATGFKMYIVRPEYLKANEQEIYGKHTGSGMSDFYEYNKVAVKASNLWKTINTMSVIPFLTGTNQQLNFSFTTSDRAANLTDGSTVRYRVLLYGFSRGKKALLYPSPSAMPMPLDHVRAFKNSYPVYDHSSSINITPYYGAGITKYELQITPVIWNGSKITATGKTKKQTITLTSETDRWRTMAPIITHGQREDLDTAYLVWIHGPWATAEHPDFYEVYDGKKLLCTVDGGTDSDVSHNAYFPLTAPGKHKLTIRAFKLDMDGKKVYGKTSAAFTLEIPKPEKAAPIISYANVNIGSGSTDKIYIQWSNPNPLLTQYEVIVIPRLYSAVFNGISLPEVEKVWSDGIGDYPRWSVSNTSTTIEINNGTGTGGMREQGYLICVIGYPVGRAQKFISDPVYARYDTSNLVYRCETVKLKR